LGGADALVLAFAMARRIRRLPGERVGLLLPPGGNGALANMAVLCAGRVAVNLDYSAGPQALADAVARTGVRTVLSAGSFLEQLQQRGLPLGELLAGVELVDVEPWRRIARAEWFALRAAVGLLPAALLRRFFVERVDPDAPALILFSSGSEGPPRPVLLSHRNVLANVRQLADVLNMQE